MRINLNPSINQSRPNFKASFARTSETKESLKSIAKEDPESVLRAMEALAQSSSKDIFSVTRSKDGSFKFNITNENLPKEKRNRTVEYTDREWENDFFEKIVDMPVSENTFDNVGDSGGLPYHLRGWEKYYDIDWRDGKVLKLNKQTNANFILEQMGDSKKQIEKIDEKIEKLNNTKEYYEYKQNNLLKHYALGVIDSL